MTCVGGALMSVPKLLCVFTHDILSAFLADFTTQIPFCRHMCDVYMIFVNF